MSASRPAIATIRRQTWLTYFEATLMDISVRRSPRSRPESFENKTEPTSRRESHVGSCESHVYSREFVRWRWRRWVCPTGCLVGPALEVDFARVWVEFARVEVKLGRVSVGLASARRVSG